MGKFKVGDRVKVMEGLIGGEWYGDLYFNSKMEKFCGAVVEIASVAFGGTYKIKGEEWEFNDDMIECRVETEKAKISNIQSQAAACIAYGKLLNDIDRLEDEALEVKKKIDEAKSELDEMAEKLSKYFK